jgi:hypothetical protein
MTEIQPVELPALFCKLEVSVINGAGVQLSLNLGCYACRHLSANAATLVHCLTTILLSL